MRSIHALIMSAFFLSGCSSLVVKTNLEEKKVASLPENVNYVSLSEPVERIPVKSYYVKDDLSRDVPNITVSVDIKKGDRLADVVFGIPYPVVVPVDLADIRSRANLSAAGSLPDILDRIASVYGLYWTAESGVVKFVKEKTLIYTIPLLAKDKLFTTYVLTSENKSYMNIDRIQKDLFDEIEEKLSAVLNVDFEGDYALKVEDGDFVKAEKERESKSVREINSEEKDANRKAEATNRAWKRESSDISEKDVTKKNGFEIPEGRGRASRGGEPQKVFTDVTTGSKEDKVEKGVKEETTYSRAKEEAGELGKKSFDSFRKRDYSKKEEADGSSLKVEVKKVYKPRKTKVVVIKDAGVVLVRVTPEEESLVRNLMDSVFKNRLQTLVLAKVYVVETSEEVLRQLGYGADASASINPKGTSVNLGLNFGVLEGGLTFGILDSYSTVNTVLNFALKNGKGRILTSPEVISLSGIPARVKAAIDFPYLEPQAISLQTGTSQLTYEIKSVSDGVEINMTPYVLGNTVIVGLGIKADQYLGDKKVEAGTLGTVDLPIKAPREVFTTVRLRFGQSLVIAGVKKELLRKSFGISSLVAGDSGYSKEMNANDLLVVLVPKVMVFEEGGK